MKTIVACALSMGLGMALVGGYTVAAPKVDVSAKKHPNLNAAQKLIAQAYDKIREAQKANEYDMDGHAAKAEEALKSASEQVKLAAEAANKNAK